MAKGTRRKHSAACKAKVALAALAGEKTLAQGAEQFEPPNQITTWKQQMLERASDIFDKSPKQPEVALKSLHAKIGLLTLEHDFFRRCAHQGGHAGRKALITRKHPLAVKKQAQLVGVSRRSVSYRPRPVSRTDFERMRRIDELHLAHPFMGARMLCDQFNRAGIKVGRRHMWYLDEAYGH